MPEGEHRLKCSECTKAGKPCVNMSWALLDKICKEYKKKVKADVTLLITVIARLLRNKKILKQANNCAWQKALCMANEMVESGKLDTAEDMHCPATSIGMCASPATQGVLRLLKESVANHGT